MTRKYSHIFFDLDHTLWDFERNSSEVLCRLYDDHKLFEFGDFSKDDFCNQFRIVNNHLWDSLNNRIIDKEYLRNERFNLVFKNLGFKALPLSKNLGIDYLKLCPTMPHIFPYVQEVLQYLKHEKKYILHILTNGFEEVQHIKLNSAGLSHYFKEVITPEIAGFQKPDKELFRFALQRAVCKEEDCVMIGDNLLTDIKGAKDSQIDQIYFNPSKISHTETITHEICCLSELFTIL